MLLLVLILVLIAFGILVVALFSGSVLLAWIAVAIALAAAAVLGYDWVQRRAAVRSGPGDGVEEGTAATAYADPEPATEVIPLVPPRRPPASAEDGGGTVVIPAWEPSGADRAPSGAGAGTTPSSGFQSRSVAEPGADDPEVEAGPEVADGARSSDDEATVVVEGLAGTAFDAAPAEAAERTEDRPAGRAPAWAGADEPATPDGPPGATAPPPDGPTGATAPPPHGPTPDDPAAAPPAGARAAADQGPGAGNPPAGGGQVPAGTPSGGGSDAPPAQRPGASDPAVLPPLGPDGAPPEEPYDPDVAAVVARLEDEVVVIDEMPRYHLGGCPALTGATGIPLPAREAVELGFTPCGWCAPDRALAARHPAGAR